MNIEWTLHAVADLDGIVDYIINDNPAAALSLEQRVHESVMALADFPLLGRPGRVHGTRELVLAGTPYIVIYRVARDNVQVLRIWHGARRWR